MASVKRANTSGITKSGTAIADVPDAPTIGVATAVGLSASVTFTAAVTGGTPTSYTVTSNPGSLTGTGASAPITVSGLSDGTAYTFTVTATNSSGTSASSLTSNSITAVSPITGGYDSLATVILSANTSSITFAGIPTGYKHLELRYIGRNTGSAQTFGILSCNGDTSTSNYNAHDLFGNGTATNSSYYGNNYGGLVIQKLPGTSSTSNIFGAGILTILDYANTTKYKTARNLGGQDSNGSGEIDLVSSFWLSTAAITSLTLTLYGGFSLVPYSQLALYGVK